MHTSGDSPQLEQSSHSLRKPRSGHGFAAIDDEKRVARSRCRPAFQVAQHGSERTESGIISCNYHRRSCIRPVLECFK